MGRRPLVFGVLAIALWARFPRGPRRRHRRSRWATTTASELSLLPSPSLSRASLRVIFVCILSLRLAACKTLASNGPAADNAARTVRRRGAAWKRSSQRSAPRVTRAAARRTTPSRKFEGTVGKERSAVDGGTAVYDRSTRRDISRLRPASPRRSRDRRSAAPYRSTIDGFASRRCPVSCCSRSPQVKNRGAPRRIQPLAARGDVLGSVPLHHFGSVHWGFVSRV